MKKRYDSPITEVVIMDVTQNFLEISAHGAQHEGFSGLSRKKVGIMHIGF